VKFLSLEPWNGLGFGKMSDCLSVCLSVCHMPLLCQNKTRQTFSPVGSTSLFF